MKRFAFTLIASALVFLCTVPSARAQSKDTTKITAKDPTDDNVAYTNIGKNGIEADYPGGADAWGDFLKHNLHYPDDAISNEIAGTVWVMFLVGKDSTVSAIQAIAGPEKGGLREEAIRVITASGKWTPALINGRPVKFYKKVPIKFVMVKS